MRDSWVCSDVNIKCDIKRTVNIIAFIVCFLLVFLAFYYLDANEDNISWILIGCAIAVYPCQKGIKKILISIITKKAEKIRRVNKEKEQQLKEKQLEIIKSGKFEFPVTELYNELKKSKLVPMNSKLKTQKAAIVAETILTNKGVDKEYHNIYTTPEKLEQYYEEAIAIEKAEQERKRIAQEQKERREQEEKHRKEVEKLRESEKVKFDSLNRFSDLYGREKRVAMINAYYDEMLSGNYEYNDAVRKAEKYRQMAQSHLGGERLSLQKESNWGILGGIADGIAGPGAGVAVALNAQRENERIREQNHENAKINLMLDYASKQLYESDMGQSRKNQITANNIKREITKNQEQEINEAKIKIVDDLSPEKCFKKLMIEDVSNEISETGTVKVMANVRTDKQLHIAGSRTVKAVIDGALDADIFDKEGKKVETAKMRLPIYGIGADAIRLEGLCLDCARIGQEYSIKFAPGNIWQMEL